MVISLLWLEGCFKVTGILLSLILIQVIFYALKIQVSDAVILFSARMEPGLILVVVKVRGRRKTIFLVLGVESKNLKLIFLR